MIKMPYIRVTLTHVLHWKYLTADYADIADEIDRRKYKSFVLFVFFYLRNPRNLWLRFIAIEGLPLPAIIGAGTERYYTTFQKTRAFMNGFLCAVLRHLNREVL